MRLRPLTQVSKLYHLHEAIVSELVMRMLTVLQVCNRMDRVPACKLHYAHHSM